MKYYHHYRIDQALGVNLLQIKNLLTTPFLIFVFTFI